MNDSINFNSLTKEQSSKLIKLLDSIVTFSELSAASSMTGSEIFPGTQSGSDVKFTANQTFTFQNIYNLSGATPSFQIGTGGFSIKDPSSNNLFLITQSGPGYSMSLGSQSGVTLSNLTTGAFTQFTGSTIVNYQPIDLGNNNPNFTFIAQSEIPGNLFGVAGKFQYGFADESAPSGFYKLIVTDNGSDNNVLYANGTLSGNVPRVGINSQLTLGINYGSSSNQNAILQANTTTKGILPPILTATQESTLVGSLGSGDRGLYWYNSTVNVPVFWDGLDRQQVLAIDNIIQGSNMTITNNGDGTVTFASSGSSGTTEQVNGAFTVYQNTTYTTPSTSSFMAIAIDATKFTAVHQNGTSVTTATINSVSTPIIQNTASGGTRYCKVTFDISINPAAAVGQMYTFGIAIQRNGGGLVQTNFQANFAQPTITTAASFKPISLSGLVDLGTNDYVYLTVLCNTASQPVVAYNFNAELTDTTVGNVPSTDALPQGTSNLYLSQNGGSTYQYMSGSGVIGNYPKFNSTGGQLADSGVNVGNLNVNGGAPSLNTTYYLLFSQNSAANNQIPYAATSLTFQNQSGVNFLTAPMLNLTNLTVLQALVSDSSKNVVSYPYTQNNIASSIVARDSGGNFSAGIISMSGAKVSGLTASKGVATDGSMNLVSTNLPLQVTSTTFINSSTQSLSLQTRYFVSYTGGQMVGTLPAATGTGKVIEVIGFATASTSGWRINAQSTDSIQLGSSFSSTGGYLLSTPGSNSDAVTLIDCELNIWVVYPALGSNITTH